ncbi:unnamed protein product [Fasciola hepatica]|uniref:Uncharacterized protein n=1 Tax=Fasciola hepatica TaxID=6192 RepID=A0ABC9HIM2_FASHE|nr:unnamed protein product [Fasciola hepatica]
MKGPPWFDLELRRLLKRRNRAWQWFRSTYEGYDLYRSIRTHGTEQRRIKQMAFEEALAVDAVRAPKCLFAYMKRRTRANVCIPALMNTDEMVATDEEKAETLAKQYLSVYSVDTGVPIPMVDGLQLFIMHDFGKPEVNKMRNFFKAHKSPEPDEVHPLMLKDMRDQLTTPLTRLSNLSLATGNLPRDWKKQSLLITNRN